MDGIDWGTWGGLGMGALGLGGDIYGWLQNQKVRDQSSKIADILANPAKLTAYINSIYQPMSAAENTAVQRDLGANWATMTGGAPGGAMNQFVADALAKIESQRYNQAASNAIGALGGVKGAQPGQLPTSSFGTIAQQLMMLQALRRNQNTNPSPGLASTPTGTGTTQDGYSLYGGNYIPSLTLNTSDFQAPDLSVPSLTLGGQ